MPELPEVERAVRLIKTHAQGKYIYKVETSEDAIVFSGVQPSEFAEEIRGRMVKDVRRYGKVFFLELDGGGRMPVLHFGMTGNVLVKGEEPLYYKEGPKKGAAEWPPRFSKFILCLSGSGEDTVIRSHIAFVDARRLGRIRLCKEPLKEQPIKSLGFDPVLNMLPLEDFSNNIIKRKRPIKALLLDQSFSAGVGNWVADEILYHARIHPEQKCHTLTTLQMTTLHQKMTYVCQTAVSVNADSTKFPMDWLFKHRWGKGKRQKLAALTLPSGKPATIRWITVGGRTSAYVTELQHLPSGKRVDRDIEHEEDEESELTDLSEPEGETGAHPEEKTRRQKRQKIH
ncbi:hypothetical protein M0805_008360 [Coniferiporia weirii]|nr:hypothetical protein M0805_008360 [Coniferiporia weirii]